MEADEYINDGEVWALAVTLFTTQKRKKHSLIFDLS